MANIATATDRIKISIADTPELAALLHNDAGGEIALRGALEDMLGSGTLILDGLRRRPRFFDGRFLTGADLTRDQDYVRQRQADMARSAGSGVISGLWVSDDDVSDGDIITITAGHGITPSGDLVMMRQTRDIPLMDLPVSRMLDAAMGISRVPAMPLSSRSGVFILGLRPVEFTANPIAAYPRSLTGQATVEDSDIIEASAITLFPWPNLGGAGSLSDARRAISRQIFGSMPTGLPQNILPLAMVALDGGRLHWVDVAMVRREIGADSGVQVALGARPRALAEAHVMQHRAHVQDVMSQLAIAGAPAIFPANKFFSLLPPAGQMPMDAVQPDAQGFQQVYFPPSVDVDIAFIPSDEVAGLVEESLSLPPMDLDASAEDIDATAVVILIPVNRQRYYRFVNALDRTTIPAAGDTSLVGKNSAVDMLDALMLRRRKQIESDTRNAELDKNAAAIAADAQKWQSAFAEAVANLPEQNGQVPLIWYVRRRAIAYRTQVHGLPIKLTGDDIAVSAIVNDNLGRLKLEKRLAKISALATPAANARVVALLGAPRISRSDVMTASVIADLEKIANGSPDAILDGVRPTFEVRDGSGSIATIGTLGRGGATIAGRPGIFDRTDVAALRGGVDRIRLAAVLGRSTAARADTELGLSEAEVLDLASDYGDPNLGEGIAAIESILGEAWPDEKTAIFLGDSSLGLPIDSAFRKLKPEILPETSKKLADVVAAKDAKTVQEFLINLSQG